jgi:chromosome segregation ATPase
MKKDQSESKEDLQSWKKQKEDLECRMEQYENKRQQLKRDLAIKYRDLIEKKLEYQRLKYEFDQYQNELELNQREYHQLDQRKSSIIDCLDKNQREIEGNERKINETEEKIQTQSEKEQKIQTALEHENREKKKKIYRIQRLTEQISDLAQQYNHVEHQQDGYLDCLKSILDMKMKNISKSIDYERELFNRRLKLNFLDHAIASKWDDILNYTEKQNRYEFDLYYEPPEEKE